MKRIVSLVTNDLNQDQRMIRICTTLVDAGYEVTLIGRLRKSSLELPLHSFDCMRINCWFESSFLFYAEYNIRLFYYLMTHRYDIINANDLDTILPAIWAAKVTKSKVVYDAHEYFTEQEEIVNRPLVKWFWIMIERYAVPKCNACITVSDGYADLFSQKYNIKFNIVKNASILQLPIPPSKQDQSYILYQGVVNYGRGLETLIERCRG